MKKIFLLATLCMIASALRAQMPQLVADIYPGQGGSHLTQTTVFNNKLYFSAVYPGIARELFAYDGANLPALVYDLNPGQANGLSDNYYGKMGVLNGKLYFPGNDGTHGIELMSYDGIGAPVLVADLVPGAGSSYVQEMKVIGNRLYFRATTPDAGAEMYMYDGVNPPVLIDVYPDALGSMAGEFTGLHGKIYFAGRSHSSGRELLVFDPATYWLGVAADIVPGVTGSNAGSLTPYGSKIYFIAATNAYGSELYSFDGTTATRITDLAPGAGDGVMQAPIAYGGAIYFEGLPGTGGQLYKYDTASGLVSLVYDIYPGAAPNITFAAVYNSKLYFSATDGVHGVEIWVYDGSNPPSLVADLYPGSNSSDPSGFQEFNGKLYFSAVTLGTDDELYALSTGTGIQAVSRPCEVLLSPNPCTGNLLLSLGLQRPQRCRVSLTDAAGRLLWTAPATNYKAGRNDITIPMTGSAGVYFYRVLDEQGLPLAAGRIVKQ